MTVRRLCCFTILFLFTATSLLCADDQQKAEKQLRKITAMATDATARGIVSRTFSDVLEVKRPELVRLRRLMNLDYGSLLIAHTLLKTGTSPDDMVSQLRSGKKIGDIANARSVSWKEVAANAKKLNAKIEDNIYRHFLNNKADKARDEADSYDAVADWVAADQNTSREELEQAQNIYVFWRDRASVGRSGNLDLASEQAARYDHARSGDLTAKAGRTGWRRPPAGCRLNRRSWAIALARGNAASFCVTVPEQCAGSYL